MPVRLHCFQHVPFEDLDNIGKWAKGQDIRISQTRFFQGEKPPAVKEMDWLVIMGGPMNIYEEEKHPWLRWEKKCIAEAIAENKKVLGICLGGQLIAEVLGARVITNQHKEIGWFPVSLTVEGQSHRFFLDFPEKFFALHWHGDMFHIPRGGIPLASSDACPHQAFAYGQHVVGLQFHLEYSLRSIERMGEHCSEELAEGPYVQTVSEMISRKENFAAMEGLLKIFLKNFTNMPKNTEDKQSSNHRRRPYGAKAT